jgi:hypothetical protein
MAGGHYLRSIGSDARNVTILKKQLMIFRHDACEVFWALI